MTASRVGGLLLRGVRHPLAALLWSVLLVVVLIALAFAALRALGLQQASGRLQFGSAAQALVATLALVIVARVVERQPPANVGSSARGGAPGSGRWGPFAGVGLMAARRRDPGARRRLPGGVDPALRTDGHPAGHRRALRVRGVHGGGPLPRHPLPSSRGLGGLGPRAGPQQPPLRRGPPGQPERVVARGPGHRARGRHPARRGVDADPLPLGGLDPAPGMELGAGRTLRPECQWAGGPRRPARHPDRRSALDRRRLRPRGRAGGDPGRRDAGGLVLVRAIRTGRWRPNPWRPRWRFWEPSHAPELSARDAVSGG